MSENKPKKMRRSSAVPLCITAMSAAFILGCSDPNPATRKLDMRTKLSSNVVTMVDGQAVTNKVYYNPPYIKGYKWTPNGQLIADYSSRSWWHSDDYYRDNYYRHHHNHGSTVFIPYPITTSPSTSYPRSSSTSRDYTPKPSAPSPSRSSSGGWFGSSGSSSKSSTFGSGSSGSSSSSRSSSISRGGFSSGRSSSSFGGS